MIVFHAAVSHFSLEIITRIVNATSWNRFHEFLCFLDKGALEHENVTLHVALHLALEMAWPSAIALDSWFLHPPNFLFKLNSHEQTLNKSILSFGNRHH